MKKLYTYNLTELKYITLVQKEFSVKSLHGCNRVKYKCIDELFNKTILFFILLDLSSFDAILGFDALTLMNATLDLKNKILKIRNSVEPI